MSCYSCSSKFGLLKKEIGCDVCGFSFCSKCCKKCDVPSVEGENRKKLICNKCFGSMTSENTSKGKLSPPLALKKRMAVLKSQTSTEESKSQWPDERDREIAERLQRLKRDKIKDAVPSEDDIAERLAKLKGMDPAKFKAPPIEVYRPPSMLTVVEEASALMKQFSIEAELDFRRIKPEDEIAARLARLRDQKLPETETNKVKSETDFSNLPSQLQPEEDMDIDKVHSDLEEQTKSLSDAASKELKGLLSDEELKKIMQNIPKKKGKIESEDEEEEANKLVEQLLASDPDVEGLDSLNDDTEESNSNCEKDEEFPWCVMCAEDAKIRCFGCESDLYCLHCFKECHDSLDIKDHKTCPYLPPKNALV